MVAKRMRRTTRGVPVLVDGWRDVSTDSTRNEEVRRGMGRSKRSEENEYNMDGYIGCWNQEGSANETTRMVRAANKRLVKEGFALPDNHQPKVLHLDDVSCNSSLNNLLDHIKSAEEYSLMIEKDSYSWRTGATSSKRWEKMANQQPSTSEDYPMMGTEPFMNEAVEMGRLSLDVEFDKFTTCIRSECSTSTPIRTDALSSCIHLSSEKRSSVLPIKPFDGSSFLSDVEEEFFNEECAEKLSDVGGAEKISDEDFEKKFSDEDFEEKVSAEDGAEELSDGGGEEKLSDVDCAEELSGKDGKGKIPDADGEGKAFDGSLKSRTSSKFEEENMLCMSQSVHGDDVIRSSGYWGIVKVNPKKSHQDRPLGNQDELRNISVQDDNPDCVPFYLAGFSWSKQYAKRRDAQREVLFLCRQDQPMNWNALQKEIDIKTTKKLGEGTYGEVFTAVIGDRSVALKVIPVGGDFVLNNSPLSSFADSRFEMVVAMELSRLRFEENSFCTNGFIELVTSKMCRGKYPRRFVTAWNRFAKEKESLNDCPNVLSSDQCYVVLAFEMGGKDLESYQVTSVEQAYAIVVQTLTALSVAEERINYEHRDLHSGNVLIAPCEQPFREELLMSQRVRVSTFGVSVKIIDFTLSRMRKGTTTIFYDLSRDEEIFQGSGDNLQFDIYRLMRKNNRDKWAQYNPKTNIMWLIYLTRYIFEKMEASSVGSIEERQQFVRFFQSIRKFEGTLTEWIFHMGRSIPNIVQFVDEQED